MFDIDIQKRTTSDLPLIWAEYEVLHFDQIPILYTGVNRYGNRVIGSSVDEDYQHATERYFHILISNDEYAAFRRREVTYRDLITTVKAIFVIDKSFSGENAAIYLLDHSDIPADYLPSGDSYCPGVEADGAEAEKYLIRLNGRWTLEDLSTFPRLYSQIYSVLYALESASIDENAPMVEAFRNHPWAGGYSTVNFYNQLYRAIPRLERPTISRIQYASPGWIELTLSPSVAAQIRHVADTVIEHSRALEFFHRDIQAELKSRGLLGLNAPARDIDWEIHREYVVDSLRDFATALGVRQHEMLDAFTHNSLVSLKMLLSFYRRVEALAVYQKEEKVEL